jgi:DNA-binding response OmpR family regulator
MAAPPSKTANAAGARCILVVEDDETVREMISRALQSTYRVFTARDGMHAAEVLPTMPALPSLVICDVMMPRVDGFTFARMIKNDPALKGVPLLFLTAKTGKQDVLHGMELGARHYMSKPFKVNELLEMVGRLVK